ncbi:beta-lactamase [Intrasporangium oryzae NRRL B-24470]|uniref:Beta-lactamase n=1 Tax=Intrasporangium oryzae NRRL B-24470 TaxID=1386089 RepID=W9G174_9MICO|nr:serine hydrolase [Intrasporangium oryzae]EWS99689.1 beta-lactamase [Intrasporangium oryzae NRRL B-24470]
MELSLPDAGGVTWSVAVHDLGGMPLGSVGADLTLRTASVGKVLLLVEAARALVAGEATADEPLTRSLEEWVGDSGLWHTLSLETLPLSDVAALVGAVSDNLATNVLLRRIGLDAVAQRATMLGLRATALHDRVRDERTSDHAETLSTGSAAELVDLVGRLASGTAVSPEADRLVRQWLSANVDQTMVGSAFVEHAGLDPIAHHASLATSSGGLVLWNKTGTDSGIRADVGAVTRDGHTIAWAAIANWSPPAPPPQADAITPGATLPVSPRMGEELVVWSVLRGMRRLGEQILEAL